MHPTLALLAELRGARSVETDALEVGCDEATRRALAAGTQDIVDAIFEGGEVEAPVRFSFSREVLDYAMAFDEPPAERSPIPFERLSGAPVEEAWPGYAQRAARSYTVDVDWLAWGGSEWTRRRGQRVPADSVTLQFATESTFGTPRGDWRGIVGPNAPGDFQIDEHENLVATVIAPLDVARAILRGNGERFSIGWSAESAFPVNVSLLDTSSVPPATIEAEVVFTAPPEAIAGIRGDRAEMFERLAATLASFATDPDDVSDPP